MATVQARKLRESPPLRRPTEDEIKQARELCLRLAHRSPEDASMSTRMAIGEPDGTELESGRWSCCDDLGQVGQFIAERDRFADHRAIAPSNAWGDGDSLMTQHADGWKGQAIWGGSRNTWIKFVAR